MSLEAQHNFLSHQVDIFYDFNPTPICAGTILSSYLIVTLASCLANRPTIKITIKSPPNSNIQDENEDEGGGRETRYVDRFYSISPSINSSVSKSWSADLAIIVLDQELKWSGGVKKAQLLRVDDSFSHVYQLYRCFKEGNLNKGRIMEAKVQETDVSSCFENSNADSESNLLFNNECIPGTPLKVGSKVNFVCEPPLPGTGLFCRMNFRGNKLILCGILLSGGPFQPAYVNLAHFLHGIFLPDEDEHFQDEIGTGVGPTIFNGEKVNQTVTPVPYQLSLQLDIGIDKETWKHKCGAVLIDERTALTAAHCLPKGTNPAICRLVAGMRTLHGNDSTRQILPVQKITPHEDYQHFLSGYDLALLTVNGSFNLTEHVNIIWISSPDDPIFSNFNGTATGWGTFSNKDTLSQHLLTTDMKLKSDEDCKKLGNYFPSNMLCGRNDHSNVCSGDSGGPLVLKNYEYPDGSKRDLLVGITSFSPMKCEDLSLPNGFTKLSAYFPWIIKKWTRTATATESETESGQNPFVCFNGHEINWKWRCDEDLDCEDGSDEKGCRTIQDQDGPTTRGCGGKIRLDEERDIIWRVEEPEPGKMSQCVWIIHNTKENPMEITLIANIDAQFDPTLNQLTILSNFTLQHLHYKHISQIGRTRKIDGSYAVLIFRGPGGIKDSGVHVRLKSSGGRAKDNPLSFKTEFLQPNTTTKSYLYPNNNNNNQVYRGNERTFLILPPSQEGRRIKIHADFSNLESDGNPDWLDIISIGRQPKSLFRLSEKGVAGNSPQVVEGGKEETLLIFMSTDSPAERRRRIKFTYSEENLKINTTKVKQKGLECGGMISVDGDYNLFYKANSSSKSNCVWLISNSLGLGSSASLFNSRHLVLNMTDSSLYMLHNFTRHDSLSQRMNQFGADYKVEQPFFLLYYHSSPFSTSTGFYLRLRHSTSNSSLPLVKSSPSNTPRYVKLTSKSNSKSSVSSAQEFSYPVDGTQESDQGTFVIVEPTRDDQKVSINLTRIHLTEWNADKEWINILTFRDRPISLYRASGTGEMRETHFTASEGQPFVIYIKSNSNFNSSAQSNNNNNNNNREKATTLGFSYSEKEVVKTINKGRCGGVINFDRKNGILYTAPKGQRSHCLWILYNVRHLNFNATALFDPTNSQLLMLKDDKSITMTRGKSTIKMDSAISALLLRSNGNEEVKSRQLGVNLDGVTRFGYEQVTEEDSLNVKMIPLKSTSQRAEEYVYPPSPASNYLNKEQVFILITPQVQDGGAGAGAVNRIQLNLTQVDTEPLFDILKIYKYTLTQKNMDQANLQLVFAFGGLGSWTNNTFLGDPGEPFLLHFHSDNFTVKSGFKFEYKEILSDAG